MKRRKLILPFKTLVLILFICVTLLFIVRYIKNSVEKSNYFKVKEVIGNDSNAVDFSYLKGSNIFSINLSGESRRLQKYFPDYSDVRVVRLLPDRLYINLVKRQAVALVRLYKYFSVDRYGYLFSAPRAGGESELPIIDGLAQEIPSPQPGVRSHLKELRLALGIIREFANNRAFNGYRIRKIDVANPNSISVLIPLRDKVIDYVKAPRAIGLEDLEIRVGADNIKGKIDFLAGVFAQADRELADIKYIDLRFYEPVIKYRDVKK